MNQKFILNPETRWKFFPHTFAHKASGGLWQPYQHLRLISSLIGPAIVRGGARFIVTVPPRHGKSELISNWVPTWFLHNNPDKKVILASYAQEFASKWGAVVRQNLTDNPLVSIPLSKSTKGKKQFQTMAGGQMISVGIGGPITGQGSDLFIIDDPLKNWQDAQSETIRSSQKAWFNTVAQTRLEPNASMIILLTRWHTDDLAGWLLAGEETEDKNEYRDKYTLINMPALCEDPETDPLGREMGEALCPERYGKEYFYAKRASSSEMQFAALYQQRPSSLEGNVIKKEWLKYYDKLPDYIDEYALFCDLSYKNGPATDFTVIECWARKGTQIYLVDQIRARMGFPEQIQAIREMAKRYPQAHMKQIEEHANGSAVIQTLKSEIMGINPIRPKTDKQSRLAAISPFFQSGNVHYPNPNYHSWVQVNEMEILSFPNGVHDDTVDTTCYSVAYFAQMNSSVGYLEGINQW